FVATFFCAAKWVQRRAAQEAQFREYSECLEHPRTIGLLDEVAIAVAFRGRWGGEMEPELVVSFETRSDLLKEDAIGVEPGDLVFVFIGHQAKGIARDGGSQYGRAGPLLLCCSNFVDQGLVAPGIGPVLISG